jgi:hypothetical protein
MSCRIEHFFTPRGARGMGSSSLGDINTKALNNLSFDTPPVLNARRTTSGDFDAGEPPDGGFNAARKYAINSDLTNINADLDGPVIRKNNDSGVETEATMADTLNDLNSGRNPFRRNDDISDHEIENGQNTLNDVENYLNDIENSLNNLKRKAGIDLDSDFDTPRNRQTLGAMFGNDASANMIDINSKIGFRRAALGNARANLEFKYQKNREFAGDSEVRFGATRDAQLRDGLDFGEFRWSDASIKPKISDGVPEPNGKDIETGSNGLPSEAQAGDVRALLKREMDQHGSYDIDDADVDTKERINTLEETDVFINKRKQGLRRTLNRFKQDGKNWQSSKEPVTIKRNRDGTDEFDGIDEDSLDPKHKGAYRALCDKLGFKRKDMDGVRSRKDNGGDNIRNKKSKIWKALKALAVLGLLAFFLQNVFDCLGDGEMGDSSTENFTQNGTCESIHDTIRGLDDEDPLNPVEEGGVTLNSLRIKGYTARNSGKPFIVRNFPLFLEHMDHNPITMGEHTGYYLHYPEDSLPINPFMLPFFEISSGETAHTHRNEHIENPEECSIEVTEEGRIGSTNIDGCPSADDVAGERAAPITVADHDEQQWKTWNNNDQCTLEYTAFQSAIECSLETILGKTIRDLGQLTSTVIKETAGAMAEIGKAGAESIWEIISGVFGQFGTIGMVILYVICGIICLIILFKLYKKFVKKE